MALSNASGVRILAREVDRDDLDVTADHVLVLKNGGPKGGPGMPEWGQLPIPKKRLKAGVRDMLRISDARMSGTSYGACILHVAPESFIGGPLALVQTGDEIEVDVAARRIHLHVGADELARRATPGNRRRRAIRAATARCFAPISARPTKVATSIFCRVKRRSRNPKFTERVRSRWRGQLRCLGSCVWLSEIAAAAPGSLCSCGRRNFRGRADRRIAREEIGIHALQSFPQRRRRSPAQRIDA